MITFTELLEKAKSEKIAVHTSNKEQAKKLLSELNKRGYEWLSGDKLTDVAYYEDFRENTCYVFSRDWDENVLDKQVKYGSLAFHQKHGYTIIEFSEIDFKENKI